MDSKSEEISSIFERFRQYLMTNDIDRLLNEFNHYRTTWSTNKFRMFLTNALVVMRTWAEHQPQTVANDQNEDWDADETSATNVTIEDTVKKSAHYLFINIVDYLQSAVRSGQPDRMTVDVEFDMWKCIVTNKWTMNEKFYIHLYDEQICLPMRLVRSLYNDMYNFYISTEKWSSSTKILLIKLGFIYLLIYDNVFLGCNHILSAHKIFTLDDYTALTKHSQANPLNYQIKLITSMNTPEKMKVFLDYYPDIDLAELIAGNSELYQQRAPLTILDRLLKMEPFYYETIDHVPLVEIPNFTSTKPNVRPANMLYLFQKLICNGAKLSINLDSAYYQNHRIPFFVSTLGFYLLSTIRYRDVFVVLCTDSANNSDNDIFANSLTAIKTNEHLSTKYLDLTNNSYIYYLIKRASTFSPLFRSFFFNHLYLSCPLLHKIEFFNEKNLTQNVRLRSLYDQIFEQRTFLTLKQRCRLLIKESINNYPIDIKNLKQIPPTLQYYLSFDFLNPNFVQITLDKLNKSNARIKPSLFDELQFHEHGLAQINGHNDWEDQIPEDIDYDNEHDDNEPDYDDHDEDADLFDEEGLYSDNDDEDEW
ncbi:unnamed protein product [Rotaria socialis]|uniref:Uncharacterized protein n=1 Tax=Rotaria socialis TaxID=392032 RepID=A0A821R4A4_9BILA|nr:unnamed protein product [Rotaria socialis]CAF3517099.1 unnamed protein product [Rotaria socialis]CAF3621305.1 unnamed protein product [Rotaria socialis]CAF3635533.1 unnamed protein product [Rotaria socialis]CAF3653421.1 unnamed protein product [Rotaria socialis]